MIYLIFILVAVASYAVQAMLQSRFNKYSKVPVTGNLTGAQVAAKMLADHGIRDVSIERVAGSLTDHYDPSAKVLRLSDSVYGSSSIAAAAVAAHECGHAVQHATGYAPIRLRSALVPVVQFANKTVSLVILGGILLINIFPNLIWIGIGLFAMTTLFSIVTLPVEINASSRAVRWLDTAGIANYETRPMAVDALKWAAYTYVIAAVSSIATLFYYIIIALGASDRR